jgi:hypothetical protein
MRVKKRQKGIRSVILKRHSLSNFVSCKENIKVREERVEEILLWFWGRGVVSP